jgi:hypothetical protein
MGSLLDGGNDVACGQATAGAVGHDPLIVAAAM